MTTATKLLNNQIAGDQIIIFFYYFPIKIKGHL